MSWNLHHTESERLASEAQSALVEGDSERARELYHRAAEAEDRALAALDAAKSRTRGITAVSALSLWLKAGDSSAVRRRGEALLADGSLPRFAREQIREIVESTEDAPASHQEYEVEITVRHTLRYAVNAASRTVAEQQAVQRWKQGDGAGLVGTEDSELVEVHARPS